MDMEGLTLSYNRKYSRPKVFFSSDSDLVNSVLKSIPEIYFIVIIDKGGNLLSYFVSEQCSNECDLKHLKEVSKLISIRFNTGDFSKIAGGLDATINVFNEKFMLVRSIFEDEFLIVSIPRKGDNIQDAMNTVLSLKQLHATGKKDNSSDLKSAPEKLKKIPSEPTEFQKAQEKLQPRKYTLVANNLRPISSRNVRIFGVHDHKPGS